MQINRDRSTGIIAICLGVGIIIMSLRLPPSRVTGDVGPAVFPIIAAIVLLITGLGLILQKSDKDDNQKSEPFFSNREWKRFFGLLAVFILYYFLFWAVGFIIATIIEVFVLATLFSAGKKTPVWQRIVFALVLTGAIYLMFQTGLGLPLPVGKFIRLYI